MVIETRVVSLYTWAPFVQSIISQSLFNDLFQIQINQMICDKYLKMSLSVVLVILLYGKSYDNRWPYFINTGKTKFR